MPIVIFSLLLLLTGATVTATGVVGIKSGEIDRQIVKPVAQYLKNVRSLIIQPTPTVSLTLPPTLAPSPSITPKPVTNRVKSVTKSQTSLSAPPSTGTNQQSVDDAIKQQNTWFEQQKQQNQAWYQEQNQQNQQQTDQWFKDQTAKAAADQKQWLLDHGITP